MGLTAEKFAAQIGVSASTIRSIECGRLKMSTRIALLIEKAGSADSAEIAAIKDVRRQEILNSIARLMAELEELAK